jgi:hypothetical protein
VQHAEAVDVLRALTAASQSCLNALGIPTEPRGKTRPWKVPGGPTGIGYHYTGGPNGIATARWFNSLSAGNVVSSCHLLVLDRLVPELETVWPTTEAAALFKVPTLLLASPERATWHMNWANSRVIGVENRNCGYSGYQKLGGGLAALGKTPYEHGGRNYEPYTREQVEANITLGRIWRALRSDLFDPTWVVAHSQVWAAKMDPGPHFPSMHEMREAIFSDAPLDTIDWLQRYDTAPGTAAEPAADDTATDSRDDPEQVNFWVPDTISATVNPGDLPEVSEALYLLGWPTGSILEPERLRPFVTYYQRSTLAWQKAGHIERVLTADGVAGPSTLQSLRDHLKRHGLAPQTLQTT